MVSSKDVSVSQAEIAVFTPSNAEGRVADGLLAALMKAKVDRIGVDLVSEAKTIQVLKRAKITKELAIGCLDARNTKLESVRELHAVFRAVGRLVPLDGLHVNPNAGLEFLPHTQALAKLKRLGEAVRSYK